MRVKCLSVGGLVCLFALSAIAAPLQANPDDVTLLWKSLEGPNIVDPPRVLMSEEGYVRFMGAPAGNYLVTGAVAKGIVEPGEVGRDFMRTRAGAFGLASPNVDFEKERVNQTDTRTYVRLEQTYSRVPVFAARATVQLNENKNAVCVFSDIMRDTRKLDNGSVPLVPSVTAAEAQTAAEAAVAAEYGIAQCEASSPELVIYAPSVIGNLGHPCLAWIMDVADTQSPRYKDRVLVNAHSGGVELRYPLVHSAKNRRIYDANNTTAYPGILARAEGDPASVITDVNEAYDYFGFTYDFYFAEHARDSIDGSGMAMAATVRFCMWSGDCPMANAFWTGTGMLFGEGFASALDVVAHELTHGVTQHTSDLVYQYESGAINESLSDIWGELTELTYLPGSPSDRWKMGEETPIGALRDMQTPGAFGDPDTYLGDNWWFGAGDSGGVHTNSGVGNKLCYLMTDGGTHNGWDVSGMGISKVADVFYEAQTNLLTPGSDYYDLGALLPQAAANIGSEADASDTTAACMAVKIIPLRGLPLRHFRATTIESDTRCVLTWEKHTYNNALYGNPTTISEAVNIVRKQGGFPTSSTDGVVLATNSLQSNLVDTGMALGEEWFYGVFPVDVRGNAALFARVIVGTSSNPLTELFAAGTDLAFSQITVRPTLNLKAAFDSGRPEDYVGYGDYVGTIKSGSEFSGVLPVAKEDAIKIPLVDDSEVSVSGVAPFPFFGRFFTEFTLSANGFITFGAAAREYRPYPSWYILNENHFFDQRLSFLFADLDPHGGGEVWVRSLDDRIAVTFESVPERHEVYGNTVQCELFNSGQIRLTYLNLNVNRAIVGLSDGRGVPLDPNDIIAGVGTPRHRVSDLSALSDTPPFELEPIALLYAREGVALEFDAKVNTALSPVQFALDDLPSGLSSATFERVDDKTYRFAWTPSADSASSYSFIVRASAGSYTASQWVSVFVTDVALLPTATNLTISPSPTVRDGQQIVGSFVFSHPQGFAEAGTQVFWYRNGVFMPALMNLFVVPTNATEVGDVWSFTVRSGVFAGFNNGEPVYTFGDLETSGAVVVVADTTPDKNGDGLVNSLDVQMVVNGALGRGAAVDGDVDGDGQSTAVDVQYVLNAALGD